MSEVYRIHTGRSNGAASWGTTEYYDDFVKFVEALAEAHLEAMAKKNRGTFLRMLNKMIKRDTDVRITRIYRAEKFINGEWVSADAKWVNPRVEVTFPDEHIDYELRFDG